MSKPSQRNFFWLGKEKCARTRDSSSGAYVGSAPSLNLSRSMGARWTWPNADEEVVQKRLIASYSLEPGYCNPSPFSLSLCSLVHLSSKVHCLETMANPKTTLFLGDLPTLCTENDIYCLYSSYGEIKEIKIMRSEETYRNLSYGFIKFGDVICAEKALAATDGIMFGGRNLKVGWASYKSKKEATKTPQNKEKMNSSSVHISYISYQLTNLITEESLRKLFSKYGTVLDCSIKKSYVDESINRQCGYGFVHFSSDKEGIDSALAAVAGLNDATLEDVCYKCSISHNLEKQLLDMQRQNSANPHPNVTSNSSSPMNQTLRSRVNSNNINHSNFNNNANLFQQPASVQTSFSTGNPRMQLHLPRSLPSASDVLLPTGDSISNSADDNRFLLESSFSMRQQTNQHSSLSLYQSNLDQQKLSLSMSSLKNSHPSSAATSPTFFASNNTSSNNYNSNANKNISSIIASANSLQVSSSPTGFFDAFGNHTNFSNPTSSTIFGDVTNCSSLSTGFESHSTSTKSNHSLFSIQSASSLSSLDLKLESHTPQHHHHLSHLNATTSDSNNAINNAPSGSFLDNMFHFPSHLSHSVSEHFPQKPVSSLLNLVLGPLHHHNNNKHGHHEHVFGPNHNSVNQNIHNSPLFGEFPAASSSPSTTNSSLMLFPSHEAKLQDQLHQSTIFAQEYTLFDSRPHNHFNNVSNPSNNSASYAGLLF